MASTDATECQIALENLFLMYVGTTEMKHSRVLSEIKCTQACRGIKGRDSSLLRALQRKSELVIGKGLSPADAVAKLASDIVPVMYQSLTWLERMDCVQLYTRRPDESLFAHLRRSMVATGAAFGLPDVPNPFVDKVV